MGQRSLDVDIRAVEEEGSLLLELEIRTDQDTMLARQRLKQIARLLGFRSQAQTQIATAGSEIVRNALNHAGAGRLGVYVGAHGRNQVLWIIVRDEGPGLSEEGSGITSARHLMDLFRISSEPGRGTRVILGKRLRRHRIPEQELMAIAGKVARSEPRSTLREAQDQNRELMVTLDALRRANEQESLRAQEWQTTFDAIPDALCLLDDAGAVLRANHAFVAFLDRPEPELVGQPWRRLSPFERGAAPSRGVPGAAEDLLERARTTRCRTSADRKLHNRWYRIQVDALLDEAGDVRRFVVLIVDITEEKRAIERLGQINEALKTYAHSISHDIKGPLAGAITANQVLQQLLDQPLTEKSSANIRELGIVISTSINKTLSLINEVLALAETGAGPGGATDVRRVIDRVIEDRKPAVEERGVRLELDSALGQVMAAPAHLYQVFANLVDNALRHTGRGELTISVERLETLEEGLHRFLFRDNGPGVPEGLEARVFDSFVRGDGTSEGSGIGLATVKRIVSTYSGGIRAYNDAGACFELEIRDAVA
jgi:PAS domain S-box-containing protein